MQKGSWIVMNYAMQLSVFQKKKYLNVLRILIAYSAHASYDLCVDWSLLFEELGFNFFLQMM